MNIFKRNLLKIFFFSLGGLGATAIHLVAFFYLYKGLKNALLSNFFSFIIALFFNFSFQLFITWKQSFNFQIFKKFFLTSLCGLALNSLWAFIFIDYFKYPQYIYNLLVIFASPLLTFLLYDRWVFKK